MYLCSFYALHSAHKWRNESLYKLILAQVHSNNYIVDILITYSQSCVFMFSDKLSIKA